MEDQMAKAIVIAAGSRSSFTPDTASCYASEKLNVNM